jgi:hypothetical protein
VDDAVYWADQTDLASPVCADPTQNIVNLMPFEDAIPARCALSPRMEMLECYTGEAPDPDPAIEAIRADWAAHGG